MAYGVILGQSFGEGLNAKLYVNATSDTASLTEVKATGVNTGNVYNGVYNSTLQYFIIDIPVYDVYTVSANLSGQGILPTEVTIDTAERKYVSLASVTGSLNDNSWATIRAVSDAGVGESLWSVGDTKEITLDGTIATTVYNNYQLYVYIIGFNHNAELEGDNRIHFQLGKIDNIYIALCDSKYNNTGSSAGFRMNLSLTNSGGWNNSYMRKNVLGNSGTPSSPPANSMLAIISSDLRSVLKSINKWTDNTGNSSNIPNNVTSTTDYFFLLAGFEVFGTRNGANSYEQNQQAQYDFYKSGNSTIRYRDTATSNAVWWWLRSPQYNNSRNFVLVNHNSAYNNYSAHYSGGLSPAFCV